VPHKNASLIRWATSSCANRAHLSKSKPDFLPEDRKRPYLRNVLSYTTVKTPHKNAEVGTTNT